MKLKAGSTWVWFVVLLACFVWVAFGLHGQVAYAWHKATSVTYPADKLGTSESCPALLNSANPDDIQYCVKRSLASAHAEGWAGLSYLAAFVLSIPVIVLGIFATARWLAAVIKRILPHDTARDRHA